MSNVRFNTRCSSVALVGVRDCKYFTKDTIYNEWFCGCNIKILAWVARVPDLRMVIVTDSRQPGMLHVDDVMQAGESRHHKELMDLQSKLSFDDPINIQFTSVTFSIALAHMF